MSEEPKLSEREREYRKNYMRTYRQKSIEEIRFTTRVGKPMRQRIRDAAKQAGLSQNEFILRAVESALSQYE